MVTMTLQARAVIEAAQNLANKVREDIGAHNASPRQLVLAFWFAKAAKSFDATCLLWEHGYWQDAAALVRTILEVDYQAQYFKRDADTFAEQFFAHAENQMHDLFTKFYGYAEQEAQHQMDEYFKKLGLSIKGVKKWKNWWGEKSNLTEMVDELGAKQSNVTQYQPLSFIVHGSPAAFRYYIYPYDKAHVVIDTVGHDPYPQVYPIAETMFVTSALYVLHIIAALAEVWPLDYGPDLKAANDAIESYMSGLD